MQHLMQPHHLHNESQQHGSGQHSVGLPIGHRHDMQDSKGSQERMRRQPTDLCCIVHSDATGWAVHVGWLR
jgi:hypothetical protein